MFDEKHAARPFLLSPPPSAQPYFPARHPAVPSRVTVTHTFEQYGLTTTRPQPLPALHSTQDSLCFFSVQHQFSPGFCRNKDEWNWPQTVTWFRVWGFDVSSGIRATFSCFLADVRALILIDYGWKVISPAHMWYPVSPWWSLHTHIKPSLGSVLRVKLDFVNSVVKALVLVQVLSATGGGVNENKLS